MQQSVLATEYLHSTITADADPTGDSVHWAFTSGQQKPTESTVWTEGEWTPGSTGNVAETRFLVGSQNGGFPLPLGYYSAYIRVTDSPEVAVKFAGYLTIY